MTAASASVVRAHCGGMGTLTVKTRKLTNKVVYPGVSRVTHSRDQLNCF